MAVVTIPYTPRAAFIPFHERKERSATMVCHRRAGKTVAICNDAQRKCAENARKFPPPRYAWFYPTRVRAKDIAWPYLRHYSAKIPGIRVLETELAIEYPNAGRITLYGAENSRGVGVWLDGAYYDERDEIPPQVIADVTPALADYNGFDVHAGMLKGRYNLWRHYERVKDLPGQYSLLLRASDSGIIAAAELARLRESMGESAYEMQLECNPNASIANAIYGREMDALRKDGRLTKLAIDPTVPLDFFFDIGHSLTGDDWTMWAVQLVGRDILFHRYYARTGEIPAHYAAKVLQLSEEAGVHPGTVYLPHDGARKDRMGRTAVDDLRDAGTKRIRVVTRNPNLWDGINTMRALLPRVYIHEAGCNEGWTLGELEMPSGIDCLDFYTKKIEAQTGLITEVPVHNQFSHGADAARTFADAYANRMIDSTSDFGDSGRRTEHKVIRESQPQAERFRRRVSQVGARR